MRKRSEAIQNSIHNLSNRRFRQSLQHLLAPPSHPNPAPHNNLRGAAARSRSCRPSPDTAARAHWSVPGAVDGAGRAVPSSLEPPRPGPPAAAAIRRATVLLLCSFWSGKSKHNNVRSIRVCHKMTVDRTGQQQRSRVSVVTSISTMSSRLSRRTQAQFASCCPLFCAHNNQSVRNGKLCLTHKHILLHRFLLQHQQLCGSPRLLQ